MFCHGQIPYVVHCINKSPIRTHQVSLLHLIRGNIPALPMFWEESVDVSIYRVPEEFPSKVLPIMIFRPV